MKLPLPRLTLQRPRWRMAGKVVVITGAGSGIGRELAREAARRGARLALSDVDVQDVRDHLDKLREKVGEEQKAAFLKEMEADAQRLQQQQSQAQPVQKEMSKEERLGLR